MCVRLVWLGPPLNTLNLETSIFVLKTTVPAEKATEAYAH